MSDTNGGVTEGQAPSADASGLNALFHSHDLLLSMLAADRANVLQIAVGDFERRESALYDFPAGMGGHTKRLIVPRIGTGGQFAVPTTVTELCHQNEGRLGGTVVNNGAFPCRLFLATSGDIGGVGAAPSGQSLNRASIWLNSGGGSWDFRFANVLYGGSVCAVGLGGATSVDVAEF